jgi:hypothetical protein
MGKSLRYAIEPESPRLRETKTERERLLETARELGFEEREAALIPARAAADALPPKPKEKQKKRS